MVLAVKVRYIESVAPRIPSVTGPGTMIMTVQNVIPWWYFHDHGAHFCGPNPEPLDTDGVLGKHIDGDRIIVCIGYPAGDVPEPSVIHHVKGDRFPIRELGGSEREREKNLYVVLV